MSKNVLITGGAGFIGSKLAIKLVNLGYTVTVLDNLSEQIHNNPENSSLFQLFNDKIKFIKGVLNKTDKHYQKLWYLLVFQMWYEKWMNNTTNKKKDVI